MNPFFSVVIPLYNNEKYVIKSIESILSQTFIDFEIIIINDGSTDRSYELTKSIKDPRLRFFSQDNQGASSAKNFGMREAKGEFIGFLDSDDEWLPGKLQEQYNLINKHPDLVWVSTGYKTVSKKKEKNVLFERGGVFQDAIDAMRKGVPINTNTVVIKREVIKNNNRLFYNTNLLRNGDVELWYKLACLYPKLGYVNKVLTIYYTEVDNSLSNTLIESRDFDFLKIDSYIDIELSSISEIRRKKVIKKLNHFKRKVIWRYWINSDNFKSFSAKFEGHIDKYRLKFLEVTNRQPRKIKRIIAFLFREDFFRRLKQKLFN